MQKISIYFFARKFKWDNFGHILKHCIKMSLMDESMESFKLAYYCVSLVYAEKLRKVPSPRLSYITVFENQPKCRIWIFEFWHFLLIWPVWEHCSCNFQVFKNSSNWTIFGIFNELLAIQNVNVARLARNVECDFFCDFQTLWSHCKIEESIVDDNRIKGRMARNVIPYRGAAFFTTFFLPQSTWFHLLLVVL